VYTQCSKCETVFKLSAEALRAASGQVRCGRCGEVFNALARLAEDSAAYSAGESPLEMETRADSILESVAELEVVQAVAKDHEEFVAPGVEIAQLEFLDADAEDIEHSMEFTLPPGELDRIFVESKRRAPPMPVPAPAPPAEALPAPHLESAVVDALPAPHLESAVVDALPAPHPESAVVDAPPAPDRVSGFEVPEDVRHDMLEGYEQRIEPQSVVRNSGRPGAQRQPLMWLGAAIVSALLLIAQVVHQNREWFVARARPVNLSAYQLRQWGVTGDPDANGTLRVRASILNTAAEVQPFPLLRVTLADRFGKRIGARDFEPGEYLGKPTARLLTPGERVDATLEILDPGKNAEGFEIDVCLRGADQRMSCANDVAPQAAR
jgi:predicted Zn finger-like uncharacterized protein